MDASNKSHKIEIIDADATAAPPLELYDDLPPARPAPLGRLSGALTALLLNEVSQTLEDVNKALAFVRDLENKPIVTSTTTTVSPLENATQSQPAQPTVTVETIRQQLARLQEQTRPAWNNLEASLHQYWLNLREQSGKLKMTIKQGKPIQPEEYLSEEQPASLPPSDAQPPIRAYDPAQVEPAQSPSRELTLDVFNEPDKGEVVVVAEHPSLQPGTIHVSLAHDILTLVAVDLNDQVYTQECLLPLPVEMDTFTQTYRNGVLEIRLKVRP